MKKSPQTNVSPTLQKLFVGAGVVTLLMQIAQAIYYSTIQYPDNQNLSGYVSYYFGIAVVLLMLIVLFISKKDRALTLKNAFDVMVVATSTSFIGAGLSWVVTMVPFSYNGATADQFVMISSALYTALPLIITLPLLVVVIRRLRAANQW